MKVSLTHKVTSLLLAFILLSYSMKSVVTIVNFVINQDIIAKTLCVQKEEQKGCNGKCQLEKALKKDLEHKKDIPLQKTDKLSLNFDCLQPKHKIDIRSFNLQNSKNIIDGKNYKTIIKNYEILTPPPLCS